MCLHSPHTVQRSPSASLQREANLAGTLERITLLALKMDNTRQCFKSDFLYRYFEEKLWYHNNSHHIGGLSEVALHSIL